MTDAPRDPAAQNATAAALPSQTLVPTDEDDGARLDAWLKTVLEIPRRQAQRLIARGQVTRGEGGPVLSKGDPVQAGVAVYIAAAQSAPLPVIEVVARTETYVVCDKPRGVAMHPLAPGEGGTLLDALAGVAPGAHLLDDPPPDGRPLEGGLCHRLDNMTSGVVLCALDTPFYHRARGAFAQHRVEKTYVALVRGVPAVGAVFDGDLLLAGRKVRVARDGDKEGRYAASTRVDAVASAPDGRVSAVRVSTRYGRRHQIRVHLAHAGHPLIGDGRHGAPEDEPGGGEDFWLRAASLRILGERFVVGMNGAFGDAAAAAGLERRAVAPLFSA